MTEQNGSTPLVAIVEPGSTHEQIASALDSQDEFEPVVILNTTNGWVKEAECQQMKLGEPDASGRRRPVPIEGEIFHIPVDTGWQIHSQIQLLSLKIIFCTNI